MKQLHFKTLFFAALCFFLVAPVAAQNFEMAKTLSKNAGVPANVTIDISNHSGDIKFNTTNENVVSIQTEIKVNARSKEDAEKLIKAIENFTFDLNGGTMEIDTRFYKNMQSINKKTTITLVNGDKVKIKDFEIRHELNIPKSAKLNLKNKYSTVILEELEGEAKLNLYSSKLRSEGFLAPVKIETKYSKLQVETFADDARLNFYDSDIEFKTAKNLDIESKYSKFGGSSASNLTLNSYDDKFLISEFDNLKMEAKYSDLVSEAVLNNLGLNLYDCNLKINSAKSAKFIGKYSELKLGNVKEFSIPNSYDNDVYLGKNISISIAESKYSKYEMSSTSKLEINSYDDDIKIGKLNPDFDGISLDGKYGKVEVEAGTVPFKVDVNMKYGKVDIPESVKITKHIEKSSQLEMLGGESGGTILLRGYDNTLIVK